MKVCKYICLSHRIKQNIPSYGNRDNIYIRTNSSIATGETANSSCWIFSNNHIGTHIDVPRHFSNEGKCTFDYPISNFIFEKIAIIDIHCGQGYLISHKDLKNRTINDDIELLLIRTGFEKFRSTDTYWNSNPGLDPSLADFLRLTYPHLRCIGFDFISITSWLHRSEGRAAHKAFLCPENGAKEILVIEDMSLKEIKSNIENVVVAPFFVEDGNGGAVTIFAKCEI